MNVTEVKMEPGDAAKAFREYRAAFMAQRNQIDGELMRSYKALSEGKTLISLIDAIRTGGADSQGRPTLAIARADETRIQMRVNWDRSVNYDPDFGGRASSNSRIFALPANTVPAVEPTPSGTWIARLPFIPPKYRPPLNIENYHLLWEAEWRRVNGPQRKDPMLLRRIGGDLFAVVAAWDLTEIEKLVLAR